MPIFSLPLSFVLGILIGSFLNVVALRYNTGMTLKGRSKCFSCGKNLNWYELIPILSFIFQKGKCKGCKGKISWQYPIVEFIAGILFLGIFFKFPPTSIQTSFITLYYLFVTCLLLVITIYDIKHKIIPNELVYTFSAISFFKLFITSDFSFIIPDMWSLLSGPILALPFAFLFFVSRGTWMGLGDSKLILGVGWTLGFVLGISAIILAFWIGAIMSVIWMFVVFKKFRSHYEIPFGPYIILGMYLVLFFDIQVIDLKPIIDYFIL